MNYLPSNLKHLRTKLGYTQSQMLDFIGIKQSTWAGYESGDSQPVLDVLIAISDKFRVPETELLHVDLSKGEDKEAGIPGKTEEKHEDLGEDKGEFSTKKYQSDNRLSVVNEAEENRILSIKMPQVITVDTEGNENVILVPVRARAGYLNGYNDPDFIGKLPAYRLPGLNIGTFRLFEVEGLSMYPTFHAGDLIIGQNVDQLQDIRDDRIYVVVTKNDGVVVKRCLNRIQKDGKLILKSDNYKERDLYPPIVCSPDDVIEVWYATGFISRQMRPPAETYNRVVDLEGRLTLLEDKFKNKLP